MTKVSVIGTGMMGTALSRAFLNAGHEVKVFDLDKSKTQPLVALGATAADTPLELVENAEVLIPSLPTYEALEGFLRSDGVIAALSGTLVVQLSSGSPLRVRELVKLIDGTGIDYLEGRIKVYPGEIGKPDAKIIFSGDEALLDRAKPTLSAVAERLEFLSPEIDAVAVYDEAVVCASYGQIWGLMIAGKLCQENNLSPEVFAKLVGETTQLNLEDAFDHGYVDLMRGEYRVNNDTASIYTWASAGEETRIALDASGIDLTVFDAIQTLLSKAIDTGIGDKAIHAIATVMAK